MCCSYAQRNDPANVTTSDLKELNQSMMELHQQRMQEIRQLQLKDTNLAATIAYLEKEELPEEEKAAKKFLSEVLGWLSILYNLVLVIQPVAVIACNMQIFHCQIFHQTAYSFNRCATVIIRAKYTMHYENQLLSTNVSGRGQSQRSRTVCSDLMKNLSVKNLHVTCDCCHWLDNEN